MGREKRVADIVVDHPSCSKQHAVVQFRLFEKVDEKEGTTRRSVRCAWAGLGFVDGTRFHRCCVAFPWRRMHSEGVWMAWFGLAWRCGGVGGLQLWLSWRLFCQAKRSTIFPVQQKGGECCRAHREIGVVVERFACGKRPVMFWALLPWNRKRLLLLPYFFAPVFRGERMRVSAINSCL